MDNPLLKYLAFVKTVETGSFTRAAQALDYAQSSISKMVADLETEWGMTLLERSKSGVCLTSAGEQIMPFLLLEHGGKTEVSDLLERCGVKPDIRFTTWEDFAIMAMVERGMGVGILPDMILRRIPYRLEIRSLQTPYYRPIGLAMKRGLHPAPAVRKLIEYLPFRETAHR